MDDGRREFTISEVVDQLRRLGVAKGDVVLVHTSFTAVRPIEDGPLGLIQALTESIGPEGTLVMPSWTSSDDVPFDPATSPCHPDLGVVAEIFRQQQSVVRSRHPFAFAARGPEAGAIVRDPLALPPHQHSSPVGRVFDRDGRILLIGVDHDANTTIHLGELMADVPYRRRKHITVVRAGKAVRVDYLENDHCCRRFRKVNAWLDRKSLQATGKVANAAAKLMSSRALVETVTGHLEKDKLVFLHPQGSNCFECSDAWRSVII